MNLTRYYLLCVTLTLLISDERAQCDEIPGTSPLKMEGDVAAQLVEGVDRFLLRELAESVDQREQHFERDFSSAEAYEKSLAPNRDRLAHILGTGDERESFDALEFVASTSQPHWVHDGHGYKVYAVRWPVLRNVHGEGLWLVPDGEAVANVIALPDADQTPELICGLEDGLPPENQFARQLAANGCRVLVPTLIHRHYEARNGRSKMTDREFLYRSAYVLGRHLVGYELQKVLAAVDWFQQDAEGADLLVGVIGNGEGGMISLYAGALDTRIDAVCVSGYFGSRQNIWQQPIDRNVFGLLESFGDAELGAMVIPRRLIVDENGAPTLDLPSEGGAPATLTPPTNEEVTRELARLGRIVDSLDVTTTHVPLGNKPMGSVHPDAMAAFFNSLSRRQGDTFKLQSEASLKPAIDRSSQRQSRQFREIQQHNEWQLHESSAIRRDFMNLGNDISDKRESRFKLKTSSPAAFEESIEPYRDYFREEIIGHFDKPLMGFNARSRVVYDKPTWTGYEVVLDVFPDVIAYGILCLPKGMKPDEKRPVVVCQHGLEGRPQDTVEGDHRAYHDYAAKLAERGYITFAPQNLYIGKDKFRTLQRKAYPLKKTLFSIIVPQHQQIINWLKTQPNVDADRIAFYGLSYGGKSAMRIPPLVPGYCLSICSADFNDWVDKNASTREKYSYVWTNEYEIFEFDLGTKFNYAEMAALIAPRPFMVERGHFDRVGTDERVAFEFARVRFLYAARLGIPEKCKIEWFIGPHTINGKGSFEFLDRHLSFEAKH